MKLILQDNLFNKQILGYYQSIGKHGSYERTRRDSQCGPYLETNKNTSLGHLGRQEDNFINLAMNTKRNFCSEFHIQKFKDSLS